MSQIPPPDPPEPPFPTPPTPPPPPPPAPPIAGAPGSPGAPGGPAGGDDGDDTGPGEVPASVYRRRRIALGAGVAAVVVLVGGLLWWRSGDGGSSPEETVRDFFDASMEQDCEELIDLVVERSWSQGGTVSREAAVDQCNADLATDVDFDAELHEIDVTAEEDGLAIVEVSYTLEGEQIDTRIDLVREDGSWKVTGV